MELDAVLLYRFHRIARKEHLRREAREQWLTMLPFMSMKFLKYISFEDYYGQYSGESLDTRSDEAILAEVEEVRRQLNEDK